MFKVLNENFLKVNQILPYKEDEKYIYIYSPKNLDPEIISYLELKFKRKVKVNIIDKNKFEKLFLEKILNQEVVIEEENEEEDVKGPIVELINDILDFAISHKASDIHFEPFEKFMKVRIRVDGILHTIRKIPKKEESQVITRLKIMAKLDIAQKRLPQDGKIIYQKNGKKVDIRVSTLPTVYGERAVLRLLYKSSALISFEDLGIPKVFEDKIKNYFNLLTSVSPKPGHKSNPGSNSLSLEAEGDNNY
ncbi:MAG TPA: secretion system protein E [Aquificae bacterium]|nr:secretion system protein E [Aquificota bacterium]